MSRPGGKIKPVKVSEVEGTGVKRMSTGMEEVDRVFGGGTEELKSQRVNEQIIGKGKKTNIQKK